MTDKLDLFLTARDKYHAHLDTCSQCRTQPFNQCPVGFPLLAAAATQGAVDLGMKPPEVKKATPNIFEF